MITRYALLLLLLTSASAFADATIKMAVRHGELRFDKEAIQVKPGEKIKLSFYNNDEMQHNVVICKPGTDTNALGMAAVALGVEGPAKQYLPKSDAILWHTPLVEPGETFVLEFTAPTTPGFYPYVCTFPGHFNLMKGIMTVGKASPLSEAKWQLYEGSWNKLPKFADLKPTATGSFDGNVISLDPKGARNANFGIVYTGTLTVPAAGSYNFKLAGDDGVRLLIDGKKVVEHDGTHPMELRTGKAQLRPGKHEFRLEYFQGTGGLGLAASISGPAMPETLLTKSAPPAGAKPANNGFQIAVDKQLEVYRTGLNLGGKHAYAVCVGFPSGMNVAFDADDCALIAVWQGGFLDPTQDWRGRGGSGSSISGDLFASFAKDAVPQLSGSDLRPHFAGYRLRDGGVEFQFEFGELQVTQRLTGNADAIVSEIGFGGGGPQQIHWPKPTQGRITTKSPAVAAANHIAATTGSSFIFEVTK